MNIIGQLLHLYAFAILGRVVLSWFPVSPGGAMASIANVVYTITEPVLGPLRRVVPNIGMFDLSPMVAFFVIEILANAVGRG
ncbi:MAG TPA: YggT family protein [Acidimicrobiales bacterium]|nr:YggT family protein [Acidimicrobiales bacterium]